MQVLEALQQAVVQAAERVGPSVVGLGRGWGRGSGVVYEPGRVLTCAHVLRGDEVAVTFRGAGGGRGGAAAGSGTRTEHGRVAGVDADLDLAVVAVDTGDAPAVVWEPAVAAAVSLGAPVLALADPSGRGLRTTFGLVSATDRSFRGPGGRRIGGSIEHTAPLPRGSSGGPLVDVEGRLLGLNAVRRDGGLILAVPADEAVRARVDALARGETRGRPRLGVAIAPPRHARRLRSAVGLPEREGLLVCGVVGGSPAERAGLRRGDLLVSAGGRALTAVDDLFDALDAAGAELALGIVRGSDERELRVALDGG
jgi:serine protease Do